MALFKERPGRVWTRNEIFDSAWGREIHVDPRTFNVQIGRLRKALRQYGGIDVMRTVRGVGYVLK